LFAKLSRLFHVSEEETPAFEVWFKYEQLKESLGSPCVDWIYMKDDYFKKSFQNQVRISVFEENFKHTK
jgi:hypothetical protein